MSSRSSLHSRTRSPLSLFLLGTLAGACDGDKIDTGDSGPDACLPPQMSLSSADAVYVGAAGTDHLGERVEGSQDLNGDGVPDVVITSTSAGGSSNLFSGKVVLAANPVEGQVDMGTSALASITGNAAYDYLGDDLQVIDFTGDGYAEVMIGARGSDAGATDGGSAYIFVGPVEGEMVADDADVYINSEYEGAYVGMGFAGGGDMDGDNSNDLAVGMPGIDYMITFRGPFGAGELDIDDDLYQVFVYEQTLDQVAASLATVDMDGNGVDDLYVAAPEFYKGGERVGKIYAVFDPLTLGEEVYFEDIEGAVVGTSSYNRPGRDIEPVDDVNGDGYTDLFLGVDYGAENTGTAGGSKEGKAVLFYGPLRTERTVEQADAFLVGVAAGDEAGTQVDVPGDVNGDGALDFLVGAPGVDEAGDDAGAAYLAYGPITGTFSLADSDVRFDGVTPGSGAGTGVSGARDVNGDGFSDLYISAPGDPGGSATGATFLLLGCTL